MVVYTRSKPWKQEVRRLLGNYPIESFICHLLSVDKQGFDIIHSDPQRTTMAVYNAVHERAVYVDCTHWLSCALKWKKIAFLKQ